MEITRFTTNKYASTRMSVNKAGISPKAIANGDASKPFVVLSTGVENSLQWSVTFEGFTPEDFEQLASDYRAALDTFNSLYAKGEDNE